MDYAGYKAYKKTNQNKDLFLSDETSDESQKNESLEKLNKENDYSNDYTELLFINNIEVNKYPIENLCLFEKKIKKCIKNKANDKNYLKLKKTYNLFKNIFNTCILNYNE